MSSSLVKKSVKVEPEPEHDEADEAAEEAETEEEEEVPQSQTQSTKAVMKSSVRKKKPKQSRLDIMEASIKSMMETMTKMMQTQATKQGSEHPTITPTEVKNILPQYPIQASTPPITPPPTPQPTPNTLTAIEQFVTTHYKALISERGLTANEARAAKPATFASEMSFYKALKTFCIHEDSSVDGVRQGRYFLRPHFFLRFRPA